MPTAMSDGIRIHFEVEGQGPALVIHHGFLGSPQSWRDAGYVDAMTNRYQVILIDARGHGRSDKPHDVAVYSYEQMAADVLAVLDAAGVARMHFWGYSMGGFVGFRLARLAPTRVRSLVLGGCQPFPVPEEGLAEMRGWVRDLGQGMAAFIMGFEASEGPLPPDLKATWMTFDAPALAASAGRQLLGDQAGVPEPYDDLTMPCLLYAGTEDCFAHDLPRAAAALPDARAVLFGGYDHGATFDNSEIVPYVQSFLERLDGR